MKLGVATFLLSIAVAQAHPEDIHFVGDGCVNYYHEDPEWTSLSGVDDHSYFRDTGIVFDWYGDSFLQQPEGTPPGTPETTHIYINTNGHLSFRGGVSDRIPTNLLSTAYDMIAPFWADIDTENQPIGNMYYKTQGDKFVVVWKEVAEYENGTVETDSVMKTNTFEVVLSDVTSPDPKICFCYCKMQWTSADSTKLGSIAFDPNPATVGISAHSMYGKPPFQLGRFGYDYDTPQANLWNNIGSGFAPDEMSDPTDYNGVSHLDGRSYCFDPSIVDNLADVYGRETMQTGETVGVCRGDPEAGAGNDPHFKTWKNEHFEYHGQCDLVLAKDEDFAEGLGLDIQIRTKLVRYWSYIKTAVIRIGNDILEIEGSSMEGVDKELHYWSNYEYQGELKEFAGFPVNIKSDGTKLHKNVFEIDLSSKYPGQKIILKTFKEFVKVDFVNPTEKSFGKTVGMLGDFKTGKTLARDGVTVLDDYTDLGREWQVLPSDKKLFREASEPQFPAMCIEPEDPRGERRRRLESSSISEEEAEAACAGLKDELDRKDCVYDILATQDLDMAGAF